MNLTSFITNKYIVYIIIIAILGIIVRLFTPKIKGWFGEKSVALLLSRLPKEEYRVINNVMLRTERGTTQIDHIVVSVYGIFVIETKNYKGWITGSEYAEQWTKNMYGKKYSFRNPLKQNYGHVKALEKLLEMKEDQFIPIVVFSINCDVKVKTSQPVVYTVSLNKTIKKYQEHKFEMSQLEDIAETIIGLNIDSKEARTEHVKAIHTNLKMQKESIQNNICPKCGGDLVKRKGKYGNFVGCSNYPKCHYTVR